MHVPSAVGVAIAWEDGGRKFALPPLDLDAELQFQGLHEHTQGWLRLPPPGHAARAEAVDALLGKFAANEFAFGGPLCLRWLSTFAGQGAYLNFLMHKGHADTKGAAAVPVPAANLAARLRADVEAAATREGGAAAPAPGPLAELWLRVVARDFPFATTPAGPPPGGGGTPAPSTPA